MAQVNYKLQRVNDTPAIYCDSAELRARVFFRFKLRGENTHITHFTEHFFYFNSISFTLSNFFFVYSSSNSLFQNIIRPHTVTYFWLLCSARELQNHGFLPLGPNTKPLSVWPRKPTLNSTIRPMAFSIINSKLWQEYGQWAGIIASSVLLWNLQNWSSFTHLSDLHRLIWNKHLVQRKRLQNDSLLYAVYSKMSLP